MICKNSGKGLKCVAQSSAYFTDIVRGTILKTIMNLQEVARATGYQVDSRLRSVDLFARPPSLPTR